jgi:tetrapyrrole methylase family protein/MazG family protein
VNSNQAPIWSPITDHGSREAASMPQPPSGDLKPIDRLVEIMRILRSPEGCPWDHKQTLTTLKDHLVEESHEVLDAIDSGDRGKLCEELGDLLLQIVFQAQIASEERAFAFDDVARSIADKLVRRHPHVFGDTKVSGAEEVLKNWEQIKKSEKGDPPSQRGSGEARRPRSALEGIPKSLPALHKAHLIQQRAARVGFEWENAEGALDKLDEEVGEIREAVTGGDGKKIGEELGDLIFAAVNVSRFFGHNPEDLLHQTIAKFTRRFQHIEDTVHARGKSMSDCSLAELDSIWEEAKKNEG